MVMQPGSGSGTHRGKPWVAVFSADGIFVVTGSWAASGAQPATIKVAKTAMARINISRRLPT
jgi:hypothetical protein